MKRFIFVLLAVLTAFTFTACSKKEEPPMEIKLSYLECSFGRLTLDVPYLIIKAAFDIENLVVECEVHGSTIEIYDTVNVDVGTVQKDRYYNVLVTGWSSEIYKPTVSRLTVINAWGTIINN